MKNFEGFKSGVNLGGWYSQGEPTQEHYDTFITADDIKGAASFGIDHVRIPIDYEFFGYDNWIARLRKTVDTCFENGLNVVIDLHKTEGYSFDEGEKEAGLFDSEELMEKFLTIWDNIAENFGNDKRIAFELLNELTDKELSDPWNKLAARCIERIRKFAPDTAIIVGSYWNNSLDSVTSLEKPYDDNIVYNFHCYEPLAFTHQDAHWVHDIEFVRSFSEAEVDADYFIRRFKEAYDYATKNGTVLYCGEYGVIDRATPEDTLEWFKAISKAFKTYDIGHSVWNYKEKDFGLTNPKLSGVIDELKKYL